MSRKFVLTALWVSISLSFFIVNSTRAFTLFDRPRHADAVSVITPVYESDQLRISTYNLEHFGDGKDDGPSNTLELARAHAQGAAAIIDQINSDFAIFQEVENPAALRLLNQSLSRPYPFGYMTEYRDKKGELDPLNIAVLSRVPLKNVREIAFDSMSKATRPPRGVLVVQVDLGHGHELLIYGVHLKSNYGDAARNQAQRIKAMEIVRADFEQMKARNPKVHWEAVVAGDMNVDPDTEQFRADPSLTPFKDWNDLWRGRPIEERATCPTRYGDPALVFPPAAFDRMLVSPEVAKTPWVASPLTALPMGTYTNQITVLPGQNGHVSDHYPVYLDIRRGAKAE
jgi:endonuclease/exonuclease/phosphatase family metal-dependent hydrolase